jgi:addiction module HigA family antidote
MATYTWGETTERRRWWQVPCDSPWGAAGAELYKAMHAASCSYRAAHGLSDDAALADDALRITVTDDAVVISYSLKEDAPASVSVLLAESLAGMRMSQAVLARTANLSTKHVSQLATGKVPISPDIAVRLEDALGVPAVDWLRADAPRQIAAHHAAHKTEEPTS